MLAPALLQNQVSVKTRLLGGLIIVDSTIRIQRPCRGISRASGFCTGEAVVERQWSHIMNPTSEAGLRQVNRVLNELVTSNGASSVRQHAASALERLPTGVEEKLSDHASALVTFVSSALITVDASRSVYDGQGYHGFHSTSTASYSRRTGTPLRWKDIVVDSVRVARLLEQRLVEAVSGRFPGPDVKSRVRWAMTDKLQLSVTQSGVTFVVGPSMAFAVGGTFTSETVTLSWETLGRSVRR